MKGCRKQAIKTIDAEGHMPSIRKEHGLIWITKKLAWILKRDINR